MEDTLLMKRTKEKPDLRSFFASRYQKIVSSFQKKFENLSQMEIEDAVSEIMTDFLERAIVEHHIENLGAFVYRSVQNRIIDYLRRKKRTVSLEESSGEKDSQEPSYNGRGSMDNLVESSYEAAEIRKRIFSAIDELKPSEKAVWIATEIEGTSFRELSDSWKVPMGTLLARKHRANANLQKALNDLIDF